VNIVVICNSLFMSMLYFDSVTLYCVVFYLLFLFAALIMGTIRYVSKFTAASRGSRAIVRLSCLLSVCIILLFFHV